MGEAGKARITMNLLDTIFNEGSRLKASDIHIVPGRPPLYRIHGNLTPSAHFKPFTPEQTETFILQLLTETQRARLAQDHCIDFSVMSAKMRYRGNALFQRKGLELILRIIPLEIPSPEDLLLPPVVTNLTDLRGGLVIVTGPTGAGKSTTVACLIDLINKKRQANIITIEDPIEFLFADQNCVVSQREVGVHSPNFSSALREVMRQDPNVIMIGEMRDLETVSAAITLAETGHLVFATLHSSDAARAVDRMIDIFPARQQQQIRTQLASVLRAVIAQNLLMNATGDGRVALREVVVVNSAISNLIRRGHTHEIYSAVEMGARKGMNRSRARCRTWREKA